MLTLHLTTITPYDIEGSTRPRHVSERMKTEEFVEGEAPNWGVGLRKGQHEGLISFETFQKVQDVLEGKKRRYPARKDHNEDFPLRGFVRCNCCDNAMTAAWTKGKTKCYAYYRCETRGCEAKSNSVPRAKMEDGFAEIMKALALAGGFFELAKAMMRDAWDKRFAIVQSEKTALKNQLDDLNRQIESLLDRIVEANNASVVSAYEDKIEKLERDKILLKEKIDNAVPAKGRFEDCMELALRFLSSPWKIYKNDDCAMRQTVLRLAFAEPLRYCQNGMYGTPELSFPFRYLGGILGPKSEMVQLDRDCLNTLFDTLLIWEEHLAQHDLNDLRCDDEHFG